MFYSRTNQNGSSRVTDWKAELEGLSAEDYFKACTRIPSIAYGSYLTFISKDDSMTMRQAHRDWEQAIDRLLHSKHPGLLRKGKELEQRWANNTYKHTDDMHWALQARKQSVKLQSVAVTGLADAVVNDELKRMLQGELNTGDEPPLAEADSSEVHIENQEIPPTPEITLPEIVSLVEPCTIVDPHLETGDDLYEAEDTVVDSQDRDELLAIVTEYRHDICNWIVEEECISCLFEQYQKLSIAALFAKEIKRVDVADAIATFGVFAPFSPTERMRSVFGETRLDIVAPAVRLGVVEEYDMCVLKATRLRMNDQRDEALDALDSIKDRKIRLMFATLIEHLPLEKESQVAEETFVATYIAPVLQGTLRTNEKISIHFPNTASMAQKDEGVRADRPDITAKIGRRELLIGEVTGPCQETNHAKNAWDLYRLARFGKALLGSRPFAPLIQIVHTKGVYMRLTVKARGMFLLERVGTFVVPTSIDMVPSLLGTIQTLAAAKEDLAVLMEQKPENRKRSWDFPDLPHAKKFLV